MIYKIRESVDIYLIDEQIIMFYFINTRKFYEFKASPEVVVLIQLIDGHLSCTDLKNKYQELSGKKTSLQAVERTCLFLEDLNVVCVVPEGSLYYEQRYERQINFLDELNLGQNSGILSQERISKQRVVIFGVGSVGGDIALLLAMAGVKSFVFVDNDIVTPANISRHIYYRELSNGQYKVNALKNEILMIDPTITIECFPIRLEPTTDLHRLLTDATFVVNTADEPYIGFTSLKISRFCVEKRIAHYIGGGFDIHVMSTGEIIIPGLTPCADCYSSHFAEVLKGWKPLNKKNLDLQNEYGGLSAQSLFSASFCALTILKFFGISNREFDWKTRGELDLENYSLHYLDTKRDPNCRTCSGVQYET